MYLINVCNLLNLFINKNKINFLNSLISKLIVTLHVKPIIFKVTANLDKETYRYSVVCQFVSKA